MSRRTQKNVGVIGLGIIGRRVADGLRHRGFSVFVWNRTPRPFPNFVGSPAEIAELCDFVQIYVADDTAVLQMVQQMKPSLKAHHIVMVHSTIAPETMREAAEIVQRRGGQLLDAPFTGSKDAAAKGELVYYIGGDEAAYRRARPVLEASSKEIIEIGEIGQATTIKLATNMITAATVQVAAEALALVDRAGIPLEKFATAMRSNGSNSGTLTMKLPKMLSGDFEPQFSTKHMLKDVQIASRLARSHGLSLALTEVARAALIDEADRGGGDNDYSCVVRGYFPETPAPPVVEEMPEMAHREKVEAEEEEEPHNQEPESFSDRRESNERDEPEAREEAEDIAEPRPNDESRDSDSPGREESCDIESTEVVQRAETEPNGDEANRLEDEDEAPSPEEEEIGNASTVVDSEEATPVAAARLTQPAAEPRGFFSRIFGRSSDY